jgi:hypothetical protein
MQVFQRIGQAMYQNVQSQPGEQQAAAAGGGAPDGGEDDVVEGEIVDEGGAS